MKAKDAVAYLQRSMLTMRDRDAVAVATLIDHVTRIEQALDLVVGPAVGVITQGLEPAVIRHASWRKK